MNPSYTTAQRAVAKLRNVASGLADVPVMVGFDGFVDSIIDIVEKRHDDRSYDAVETITRFSDKILAAAGKSSNYELVVKNIKLGGNGPILANAFAAFGLPVTYIGALGYPNQHPVFADLTARVVCHSIANPGFTDALEFDDGKLLLGKYDSLNSVGWKAICEVLGESRFIETVQKSHLIAMVNWSLLSRMQEIWQGIIDHVLPKLTDLRKARRIIFVDLADPEKRLGKDLLLALASCTIFAQFVDVILGLNLKESLQVAAVLNIDMPENPEQELAKLARVILEKMKIQGIVIHSRASSSACLKDQEQTVIGSFINRLEAKPKISTGAGDNFNSGFCLGRLAQVTVEESLCIGASASAYYVRSAHSPTLEQLIDFMGKWFAE